MSRNHWEGFALGCAGLLIILIVALAVARAWPSPLLPMELTVAERVDAEAQLGMASAAWWMLAATALSIATGVVGLWFIVENLRAARAVQAETAASARAAERAAEAAAAGNIVAREMGVAQTRAYLAVTDVVATLGGYMTFSLTVRISNSGTTPAINLRMDVDFSVFDAPESDGAVALKTNSDQLFAPSLPAGKDTEITARWIFAQAEVEYLQFGRPTVEASGAVQYTDVFGTRHTERFAYNAAALSFQHNSRVSLTRLPDPSSPPGP